jgi:hypothetical protein
LKTMFWILTSVLTVVPWVTVVVALLSTATV